MKKILMSILVIGIVATMFGAGTFAYFTDVEKSTGNTMSAGTLDIEIGDNNEGYSNNPVTASFNSPANLAPGETFETGPVYLKNVGTMDIGFIWARFCNLVHDEGINTDAELSDTPARCDISKYIKLVSVSESNDGGTNYDRTEFDDDLANAFLAYWIGRGAPLTEDGVISLYDLVVARNYGSGDYVTSIVLLNYFDSPILTPGSVAAFKFEFQLLEATPNAYQGDTATFEVDFIGSARTVYPDDLLWDSITEALGS